MFSSLERMISVGNFSVTTNRFVLKVWLMRTFNARKLNNLKF